MSNLIIMPGTPEFNDTTTPAGTNIFAGDLTNRVISLDLTKSRAWQCGGFSVNFNNPVGTVPPKAQQDRIRQALIEGILIDVTDQPNSGLMVKGSGTSATTMDDTGKKIFLTLDSKGGMAIIIPKDDIQLAEMEESLKENGILVPDNPTIQGQSEAAKSRVVQGNVSTVMDSFANKFKG